MKLVSYVSNRVDRGVADRSGYLTVRGVGGLKAALKGVGILYSELQRHTEDVRFRCRFMLKDATLAEYSIDNSGGISVKLDAQSRFPCSGFVASTGEGYIVSPAFKLEPINGPGVVMMFLAPRTTPFDVSVEKTVLAIPNYDSVVTVSSEDGEIRCVGTISSRARRASIILNRRPGLPAFKTAFDETLSQITAEGHISANWRPVARSFQELIVAFDPWKMFSEDVYSVGLDRILSNLGALDPGEGKPLNDYVLADGSGSNYTLRLTVDHGLGRHRSDEVRVTVA
ncbi:MAG TPA: hypothetical protein VFE96_06925 [Candidatus Bathyarchaeia archaeon]|nr:hypothetical protein [Candidatus Bathyarchaeia archaeon]